jgi:DNA polymerase V
MMVYSIDEIFIDAEPYKNLFGCVETIARRIQMEIWDELRLITTVGIGPNPLLAKVCMDTEAKKAPEAFARWRYEDVPAKIWTLPKMTDFWGLGAKTEKNLNKLGINSLYELAQADSEFIKLKLGVIGEELYYHIHGVDYTIFSERYKLDKPVHRSSSSVGNGQTLMRDYYNNSEIMTIIMELAEKVATRLRRKEMIAGVVKLSVGYSRHSDGDSFSHQMKIEPTNSTKKLIKSLISLFRKYHEYGQPVRQIRVCASKLQSVTHIQFNLFEPAETFLKKETLEKTIDAIRDRWGKQTLIYGYNLTSGATALKRLNTVGGHQG